MAYSLYLKLLYKKKQFKNSKIKCLTPHLYDFM